MNATDKALLDQIRAVHQSSPLMKDQVMLRDQLAMSALNGLIGVNWNCNNPHDIAVQAYRIADEMIKARK